MLSRRINYSRAHELWILLLIRFIIIISFLSPFFPPPVLSRCCDVAAGASKTLTLLHDPEEKNDVLCNANAGFIGGTSPVLTSKWESPCDIQDMCQSSLIPANKREKSVS